MQSRERVRKALMHKEADRIPIDLGSTMTTGIMAITYNKLKAYLGIGGRTRICDVRQMLAEPEMEVLERIGGDFLSVPAYAAEPKKWKKSTLPNGSPCELPRWFSPEILPDGSQVLRNSEGQIIAKKPKYGYYFDSVYHPLENVKTIEELERLDENVFHSSFWSKPLVDDLAADQLHERVKRLYETTDKALVLSGAGRVYEWAQDLRGWNNFLIDLKRDPRFAGYLLDRIVEENIKSLKRILPAVKGYVQVVQVSDDLGTQSGLQLSPKTYREIVKPRHERFFRYIKENSGAYLLLHCDGSIYQIIPDLIELGVDALNPIQYTAKDMDTKKLKLEFGEHITFWGGGCDTQHVLLFGTPNDVRSEVKKRISDLAPGGGFVFSQIHNIQKDVPVQNIIAMYEAVKKYGTYPLQLD